MLADKSSRLCLARNIQTAFKFDLGVMRGVSPKPRVYFHVTYPSCLIGFRVTLTRNFIG